MCFLYGRLALGAKLLNNLRNRSSADGVAAFANRESQTFLQRYRRNQRHFAAHVISRHHHFHSRRQFHVSGHVRGAEIKLWPVARKEWRMTSPFFLRQHVRFRLALGVRRNRTRLANPLPAFHIFFFRPAQQQSYVVARNPFIEQLPEHLHTGHNLFLRRTKTHNLDFFAHFHFAPFDSSRHHRAATGNRKNILNRHRKRLVHIAHRQRYVLVHRFHQFVNLAFPLSLCPVRFFPSPPCRDRKSKKYPQSASQTACPHRAPAAGRSCPPLPSIPPSSL